MNSYDDVAPTLDWWTNDSTCLGSYRVELTLKVAAEDFEWGAVLPEDELEGFDFLMELSPYFTLYLAKDNTIPVHVIRKDGGHDLTLRAWPW